MKKALSFLIAIIMITKILPSHFIIANAETSGDYTYTVSDSKATITEYNGAGGDVVIPDAFGLNIVTTIETDAFAECTGLKSVEIPKSVTTIEVFAFTFCNVLTQINVNTANLSYSSLDGVLFNLNKTTLIQYPCGKTGDYLIPNSVNTIEYGAFALCNGLTSVTISNSVTTIGDWAFQSCRGLTSVEIQDGVTTIGDRAFVDCNVLTQINVNPANLSYSSLDGVLFNQNKTTLIQYPCGKTGDYLIPNSVNTIGDYAFVACNGLTSVTISNSVTTIGDYAFDECTGLTSVEIQDGVTSIGRRAFAYCEELTSVTIPDSVTTIGDSAFYRCSELTSVEIPDSVTTIGYNTFAHCTGLTSVEIPDSVTTIGDYAFYNCTGLTSVAISNSVTTIGDYAFAYCTGLTSVEIPNSVTTIGDWAFYYCTGLTSVIIPNSVTTVEYGAFIGCDNVTIHGIIGSYAEEYAVLQRIPFAPLYITSKNNTGCIIDYTNMFIYGIAPNSTSLNDYIIIESGYELSYIPNGVFGTGTIMNVIKDGVPIEVYTIVIFGDVNGNGNVNVVDALMTLQASSGITTLNELQQFAVDVNKDGKVSVIDALKILQYSSGLITEF